MQDARRCESMRRLLTWPLTASVDVEILGEIGVHLGFGKADDFGRELDKRQATLPHQVVNRSAADIQPPGDLRLGFVVRQCGALIRFRVHGGQSFLRTPCH